MKRRHGSLWEHISSTRAAPVLEPRGFNSLGINAPQVPALSHLFSGGPWVGSEGHLSRVWDCRLGGRGRVVEMGSEMGSCRGKGAEALPYRDAD